MFTCSHWKRKCCPYKTRRIQKIKAISIENGIGEHELAKSGEVRSSFIFSHWKASGKMIWILFYEKIQSISFRLCILPSIELDERKKHKKNIHFMIMWTLWFPIFYFVVSQNQPFFIKWGVQSIHSVLNLTWKIIYDKIRQLCGIYEYIKSSCVAFCFLYNIELVKRFGAWKR